MAAKLAIMTFTTIQRKGISINLQMNNIASIAYYSLKMGSGTKNAQMVTTSKRILDYLLQSRIMITAEYILNTMNKEADRELRQTRDSSEWKLCPKIFR